MAIAFRPRPPKSWFIVHLTKILEWLDRRIDLLASTEDHAENGQCATVDLFASVVTFTP